MGLATGAGWWSCSRAGGGSRRRERATVRGPPLADQRRMERRILGAPTRRASNGAGVDSLPRHHLASFPKCINPASGCCSPLMQKRSKYAGRQAPCETEANTDRGRNQPVERASSCALVRSRHSTRSPRRRAPGRWLRSGSPSPTPESGPCFDRRRIGAALRFRLVARDALGFEEDSMLNVAAQCVAPQPARRTGHSFAVRHIAASAQT